MPSLVNQPLAIHGGPKAVPEEANPPDIFAWPTMTEEDEQAAIAVIRSGRMSENDISVQFEHEFAGLRNLEISAPC